MSCRGVIYALSEAEAARAASLRHDDEGVLEYLEGEIAGAKLGTWEACELDKSWDALHRCVTDGRLDVDGSPASSAILGGRRLYIAAEYIITLKSAEDVRRIAAVLGGLGAEDIRRAFDAMGEDYVGPRDEDDREYTVEYFGALRGFYERAAGLGAAAVFVVDQ